MNYALDALWWRLKTPQIRDLAALLTAPPLWDSGCEMPVRKLLGETGFRVLLDWDDRPSELLGFLNGRAPFGGRLGFYAEALLAFWLANAPHCRLHAQNLVVAGADGSHAGALDFLAEIDGELYHLELCCKYYGPAAGEPDLCGLNRSDRLPDKAAKLQKQLGLAQTEQGRAALQCIGIDAAELQTASLVRGMAFLPDMPSENRFGSAGGAWTGSTVGDWEEFAAQQTENSRYFILPRMKYLSPARVPESETVGLAHIAEQRNILFALLEPRPDGFYHEIRRFMKR